MSRHSYNQHRHHADYLKKGQTPHDPWHLDWYRIMMTPGTVWITADSDSDSVRSERVIRQNRPAIQGSDGSEDGEVE